MRVCVHHRASAGFERTLREASPPSIELDFVPEDDRAGLARSLETADALLHVLEPLSRATLSNAPRLLLVQKIGVGVNTIDVAACQELGIGVANMPGTNTQAVAEHALALMLAALRRIPSLDAETRAGRGFPVDSSLLDVAGEVSGRVVGLVGYGAVAARLAPVLVALGASVMVSTRDATKSPYPVIPLDELVTKADVVSLHVPLTPDTKQLLSFARIAAMKPGAVLVNTSRGGLVDQPALVTALREGRLRAAGLDVFADEPTLPDDAILTLPNVVATPHIAWRTPETLSRSFAIAMRNCLAAHAGTPLEHEVVAVRRSASP